MKNNWEIEFAEKFGSNKDYWLLHDFIKSKLSENEERNKRIVAWATGDDTGMSSNTVLRFMSGLELSNIQICLPPSDAGDRGRCIRLLNLFPEWWDRLDEMRGLSDEWNEQIDLIKQEKDN